MRAIIRCNTKLSKEAFQRAIDSCGWWPPLQQDDSDVNMHRAHIISLISPEDARIVEATTWYMIYKNSLRTWGLVNCPQNGIVEIRLRNQSSPDLRKACDELVSALQNYVDNKQGDFEFSDAIEVLEPNSLHHAYYGEPLPASARKKWLLARTERRGEWISGNILLAAAILLIILTIPYISSSLSLVLTKEWINWFDGVVGRLATSALASSAVSYVAVLIHFFGLKRLGTIRWQLLKYERPN
jgi:hypothetical protein